MSWVEAVSFGKYGPYVWSCYGLTTMALVCLALATHVHLNQEIERARRRLASSPRVEGVDGSGKSQSFKPGG